MAALDSTEEDAAAACLDPAQAEWFRQFLTRLRTRPKDQDFSDWIAPQMDLLWNNILHESVRNDLKTRLGPAHDPASIAAVVNGLPVRRVFVRALRETFFDRGSLQFPHPDPTRPWTTDPALAIAVRFALLEQDAARKGIKPSEALIDEYMEKRFPHLKEQPDEQWIAETGINREETKYLMSKSLITRGVFSSLVGPAKAFTDAEIAAFYQKNIRELSRTGHLHLILSDRGDGSSFARSTRSGRLVTQTVAALKEGLPFSAMRSAAGSNERSGLGLVCEPGFPILNMAPPLIMKLETMEPGGFTEPAIMGANCIMICLEGWSDAKPRPFSEVKAKLAALMEYQETCARIDAWCRQHEATAWVEVLDHPQPEPASSSAFADLLKKDSFGAVGQLGDFWQKALAKDKQAGEALDSVIAEGFLDVPDLVLLADSLLAHDQKPLAILCVKEASDRNPTATRKAVEEAVSRHKSDGFKGQQDQIRQIIQPAR
jgi:hypothetical protein